MMESDNFRKQEIADKVKDHYASGYEDDRLLSGNGQLEFERTCELLKRFLPKPPAKILDVGGGSGIYSYRLARLGYETHLVDIVPKHIELALEKAKEYPEVKLASAKVGDARELRFEDDTADVVLFFGPLYHLTDRADRIKAMSEAFRVLKPKGLFFGAGISRFASTFDGLRTGYLKDPEFMDIVKQDLTDGQHRNKSNKPGYFMDTFFHHPDELQDETTVAGFSDSEIFGIEGPAWLAPDFNTWWKDKKVKEMFLHIARTVEQEKSVIGTSAHFLVKAVKN